MNGLKAKEKVKKKEKRDSEKRENVKERRKRLCRRENEHVAGRLENRLAQTSILFTKLSHHETCNEMKQRVHGIQNSIDQTQGIKQKVLRDRF
ncbi:hypothetical protein BgiMline_006286 [Biomphalaria glabrata]